MFRSLTLTVLAVLISATAALAGETYVIDKDHSETGFTIRHMMGRVAGGFTDFGGTIVFDKAKPEQSSVEFRIKSASIDTNNQKRDDHLRSPDFFDAAANPEIVFKSTKVVPKSANAFDVHGTLTMRGVTKAIVLPVKYLGEGKDPFGNQKASWETSIVLNRKDYGIVWNKTLDTGGWLLGDDVTVTINLQAARQVAKQTT